MAIVYLARNKTNGKCYIGVTIRGLEIRRSGHRRDAKGNSQCIFHRAIRKYGFDSFEWVVLFSSVSKENLDCMEMVCIAALKTKCPYGYNMTDGGGGGRRGTLGTKHSEETKRRISAALMGYKHSEETKQRIGESAKGNKSYLGRKHSGASRRKMSKAGRGRLKTEEHKQKIAEASRGNNHNLGHRHTEETKRKMKESTTLWWKKKRK